MKQMQLWCVLAVWTAAALAWGGEVYQSKGFAARLAGNGVIRDVTYGGAPLMSCVSLIGNYSVAPGSEKHDPRFFQQWDESNAAQFRRDGDILTMTIESQLSNKVLKNAANYRVTCVFEPDKITLTYEVTGNVELWSDYRLFGTQMMMSPELFGRGLRQKSRNNQEDFKVIPQAYNAKFTVPESVELGISTGKVILSLTGGEGTTFSFLDCRAWGAADFALIASPPGKWTPQPVAHPAESTWVWSYTITATAE